MNHKRIKSKQSRLQLDYTVYIVGSPFNSYKEPLETTINKIEKGNGGIISYGTKDNHHFTELGYGSYWTTSLKKAENIINSRTTDRSLEIKKQDKRDAERARTEVLVKRYEKELIDKVVYLKDSNSRGGFVKSFVNKIGHYGTERSIYIKGYNVPHEYPIRNENKTWYLATPEIEAIIDLDYKIKQQVDNVEKIRVKWLAAKHDVLTLDKEHYLAERELEKLRADRSALENLGGKDSE